jgi:hypothetical protein
MPCTVWVYPRKVWSSRQPTWRTSFLPVVGTNVITRRLTVSSFLRRLAVLRSATVSKIVPLARVALSAIALTVGAPLEVEDGMREISRF